MALEWTHLVPGLPKLLCYDWGWGCGGRKKVKEREVDRSQTQEVLTRSAPGFSLASGPSQGLLCRCGHQRCFSHPTHPLFLL